MSAFGKVYDHNQIVNVLRIRIPVCYQNGGPNVSHFDSLLSPYQITYNNSRYTHLRADFRPQILTINPLCWTGYTSVCARQKQVHSLFPHYRSSMGQQFDTIGERPGEGPTA